MSWFSKLHFFHLWHDSHPWGSSPFQFYCEFRFETALDEMWLKFLALAIPPNCLTSWRFKVEGTTIPWAECSPATDAKKVFVGSPSGIFYALDKGSGEVVWEYKAG
jgi:hypothetical protein